jgi:hypothetical protein
MSDPVKKVPKRIFIVPYRNRVQHKFFFCKYMSFILENDDLSRLEWKDNSTSPPNINEINFEYSKLLQEYESYDYWRNRKKEYIH